jgi:hypothetical protein
VDTGPQETTVPQTPAKNETGRQNERQSKHFCKILGFCGIQDMSYDLDYDIFYSIVEGYKCSGDSFCLLLASYSGFKARYLRNVDIRLLDYKVMS